MVAKFIVIEGMDGTGTTTQTKMLATRLVTLGYKVETSFEPTKSVLGQEIRSLLKYSGHKSKEFLVNLALCFAADRMQHAREVIMPALLEKDFIILDRYVLSSLVYQGMDVPTNFVKAINQYAPTPHLTLVLDLDVSNAFSRIEGRSSQHDFYETKPMLEKIRERYRHFAQKEANTVLIDAHGDVEQVHQRIFQIVSRELGV